jgi:hypothetical protein
MFRYSYINTDPAEAMRSKELVFRHYGAGVSGSNPDECMGVCLV